MPTLSTLKRPASSLSLKRPASSINDTISKLQKGVSKTDLDEGSEHSEEDDDKRDKAKGQKYQKMKSALPDHVIDLIEKQSQKASSPRLFKTQIINKLFKRNPDGRLELNLDDDVFSEHRKIYSKKFSKEKETAYPESILRGLYFNNSQDALDRAKQAGEVVAVEGSNGKTLWAFESLSRGVENAKVEEQRLASSKKVSKEQAKMLAQCFAEVGWSWRYSEGDVQSLQNGKKIPQQILDLCKQATDSQNKLCKEAMTLIKGWKGEGHQETMMKLKRGHATCTVNLAKLAHMKEFRELPDDLEPTKGNLDNLMQEMALHTKSYNELIETSKGILRSQKN